MCEDLKVPFNVQAAHESAPKWHDMVHVVANAGGPSQSQSLRIERPDSVTIRPRWHSSSLGGFTLACVSDDFISVVVCPLFIVLALTGLVGLTPLSPVFSLALAVLLVPFLVSTRILAAPFGGQSLHARQASVGPAIGRGSTDREVAQRFCDLAGPAHFQSRIAQKCLLGSFSRKSGLAQIGTTGLADRCDSASASRSALSGCAIRLSEFSQCLTGVARRACLDGWGDDKNGRLLVRRSIGHGICTALVLVRLTVSLIAGLSSRAAFFVAHFHLLNAILSGASALLTVLSGSLSLCWAGKTLPCEATLSSEHNGMSVLLDHASRITHSAMDSYAEMALA